MWEVWECVNFNVAVVCGIWLNAGVCNIGEVLVVINYLCFRKNTMSSDITLQLKHSIQTELIEINVILEKM
jgi:hypothetical protein